jgi:two-component system, LytTR family, response regulator
MINAIIVDDERLGRETISGLISEYCPEVRIVAECENIVFAKLAIEGKKPDLIFLDIAMPGGTGFDLLKSLEDINFEIIFVTAHEEHVLKALRLSAVDYLLKPIDEDELISAIEKVVKNQKEKWQKTNIKNLIEQHFSPSVKTIDNLCIPTNRGFQILKLNEIICCEANNTYTIFYLLDNQQILSTKPLADYDFVLNDSGFVRVHKSWLINMHHVKEYRRGEGGTVLLTNNKSVDVSRRKKEHFVLELKKVFKF